MDKTIVEKIADIEKKHSKQFSITGRELFQSLGFERRTSGNCQRVDAFLEEHDLMVDPHYNDVWIDAEIVLKHKPMGTTKINPDPIVRVKSLKSANVLVADVQPESNLVEAVTIMQVNSFSQLPVTKSKGGDLLGYISWESIGIAQANGVRSEKVKDYYVKDFKILSLDTPIIDAFHTVIDNEFAFVVNDHKVCGIITKTDVSERFLLSTEAYFILEEIENQIRLLLNDKLLLEDVKNASKQGNRVQTIDDLTFGEYIQILKEKSNWDKLHINVDQDIFIKKLDEVREIRNDVMHFDPDGISDDQKKLLNSVAESLININKYSSLNQESEAATIGA